MRHLALSWRKGALAALAIGVAVAVTAAGASGRSTATVKVGAALIGPKNDKSFNQAAYEGILKATKRFPALKLTSVLENKATDADRTSAVETLAPIDGIVVGVSAAFGPVFDVEAPKFPSTTFVTLFGAPAHYHANVYSFVPDRGYPAYVAGVIAAHLTKTKVVGFVGGADIPPTEQSLVAFVAGVHHVSKKITVLKNIIGDFNDVSKAKAATAAMLADKADVILPYLDAGIAGAYAAGKAAGTNPPMFKLDVPDCTSYSNIIGTDQGNNTVAAFQMLKGITKQTLKPAGEAIFAGLQDPTLQRLTLCPKYKRNKTIASVWKSTIKALNSGMIKLPKSALNPRPPYPYREGFDGKLVNANMRG